ncbi:MAG: tripartite tricarboxylate transporter substrate binding protein [Betaproteobacteria bacterium]
MNKLFCVKTLGRMVLGCCVLSVLCAAYSQNIPTNIRIIIPLAAGGPTDIYGRLAAEALRNNLKATVVTENHAGGNGAVGVNLLKQGATDGSNLLFASSGMITFFPLIDKSIPYDPVKDLVPIVCIAQTEIGVIVAKQIQANSIKELVALAKSSSTPLSFGSAGKGNILHAYIELLKDVANIELLHIPYKGATPAYTDVLGGQISGMFISVGLAKPSVQTGKVKMIAVVGRRSALLPDVPTISEQGFSGLEILPWFAIMGPRGISAANGQKIADAITKSFETDDFKKRLAEAGAVPLVLSGQNFTNMINTETAIWSKLIKEKNIALD